MTIQEMTARKLELGLSNEEISRRSGIPVGTLQKLFSGKTKAPREKTIRALENVLAAKKEPKKITYDYTKAGADLVAEPAIPYGTKKQGEYTLEDYYALPDERRVELIDGVFYDMSAPSLLHQRILGELHLLFEECISRHDASCEVYLSPCDVQLDMDNKTMLQPDLFVVCRDYDRTSRSFYGAPDLIVEILSPSTRRKDMMLKMYKYQNAGVKEYWMIDPKNRIVICFDFTTEDFRPEIYPFDASIPVAISNGSCSIDFGRVSKKLEKFYS